MICCSSSIKKSDKPEQLLKELREMTPEVGIKLNEYKMEFNPVAGEWNTNFSDMPWYQVDEKKKEISNLQKQSLELSNKIDAMEREYLAKIARLLIMAQVHCEIKEEIHDLFDKLEISHKVKERERVEEIAEKH